MLNRQEYPSLRQGLVGAFCPSLSPTSASLIDRSGRGSKATLVGSPTVVAEANGTAIKLDGSSQRIDITLPALTTASLTVHGWGRFDAVTTNNRFFFSQRNGNGVAGIHVQTNGPNVVAYWTNSGTEYNAATGLTWAVGRWMRWAMVVDRGLVTTVVDNRSYTVSSTSSTQLISGPWYVGYEPQFAYTACTVDDIRIYNRALTASELNILFMRRGIGLSPLPDRAAGLPRKLSVNVGGTWRPADAYVNVGGTWKLAQASTNVAGTWR